MEITESLGDFRYDLNQLLLAPQRIGILGPQIERGAVRPNRLVTVFFEESPRFDHNIRRESLGGAALLFAALADRAVYLSSIFCLH